MREGHSGHIGSSQPRVALERNAQARAEFGTRIGEYTPDQLVFVD
jgi:hypothetical protein